MADGQADHSISLNGSADLVTEFFSYGVNTLLFQRGIYPAENFSRVVKYGLTMLVSTDPAVLKYLESVLAQMKQWLQKKALKRVVVVFASVATEKVLERWAFDVNLVETESTDGKPKPNSGKDEREIVAEIQAVVRQITASVTFLPLLDEACSFDMLIYTDENEAIPAKWEESGPRTIRSNEQVNLRSFATNVHNVEASVTYARDDS